MKKNGTITLPCGKMCERTLHAECIYYNARKADHDGWGYCEKLGGYKNPFENTSCNYWISK